MGFITAVQTPFWLSLPWFFETKVLHPPKAHLRRKKGVHGVLLGRFEVSPGFDGHLSNISRRGLRNHVRNRLEYVIAESPEFTIHATPSL